MMASNTLKIQMDLGQPRWQRLLLLIVLCYEAAGCLLGGVLLVAAPDGSYMDMPVDLMNGFFNDFIIPGIILFALGILNTIAFVAVFKNSRSDWVWTGLALGGLYIWFVVEIVILQELHWLHFMWGFPVFLGWIVAIPLIASRNAGKMMENGLLACGILSSLWYLSINIVVPLQWEEYKIASYTVSELSAIGAPTRILWVLLVIPYPLLFAAFGWGVLHAATANRHLRVVGVLIIVYSIFNFFWPPMHQREVIAAGDGTLTDTLHIVWAMTTVLFMMVMMGFGAAAFGKIFRIYTLLTFVVFLVFGILIGIETPGIEANFPTPHIGTWERLNIGAFMLWVIVFALVLLRKDRLIYLHADNVT